eukprot:g11892.t1
MLRYRTLLVPLMLAAACEDYEEESMQVMLIQSKLRLHSAAQANLSSVSSFLMGVDALERRVQALSDQVAGMEKRRSGTPWLFLPLEAVFSLDPWRMRGETKVRKLGDFVGDLVLHPHAHAWQQLLVFAACTAGVIAAGMSLKSPRWCDHMGGKLPAFVFAVDIVSDFVSDTVTGIADGVHGMLNFATGTEDTAAAPESHLVKIVIAELIGAERTLGLRIENRLITAFTKPEAARFGWRLGDCIQAVGRQRTPTQEVMLEKIAAFKEEIDKSLVGR